MAHARIGQVQDKIEDLLDALSATDQERVVTSLAKKVGLALAGEGGGGRKRSLGSDDFGTQIQEGDDVIETTSSLGTRVRVNTSRGCFGDD